VARTLIPAAGAASRAGNIDLQGAETTTPAKAGVVMERMWRPQARHIAAVIRPRRP